MNNNIYPCLWFEKEGREAAAFYQATFPHTKLIQDSDMVSMLSMNGQNIMLLTGGPMFKPNSAMSIMVLCDDKDEVQDYWNKLSLEGKSLMELNAYPWSEKYGWVKDKYGIDWQVYYSRQRSTNQKFVPTLMFTGKAAGRCEEAIHFYTELFPNSTVQGILKYPEGVEGGTPGQVQHAQFNINGYTLMAMDSSMDHGVEFSEGNSITVITQDQEETDYYWNGLIADGGEESMCGWLKDKFGLSWQIVPQPMLDIFDGEDKAAAERARQAMLKMRKIDISEIKAAANNG